MSNEQVLSGAMEVFKQAGQSGQQSGDMGETQGQQQGSSVLDRTASGTAEAGDQGTGEAAAEGSTADRQGEQGDGQTGQMAGAGQLPGQGTAGQTGPQPGSGAEQTGQMAGGTLPGQYPGADGSQPGSYGTGDQTGTGGPGATATGGAAPGQGAGGTQPGQYPAGTAGTYGSLPGGGYGAGQEPGAAGRGGVAGSIPGGTDPNGQGTGQGRRVILVGPDSGVVTQGERVGELDRELEEQMRVFDGIILGRRQDVLARSAEDGAGDIQYSAGGGGDAGGDTAPVLTASAGPNRSRDPNDMQTAGQLPDAPSDNRQGDYQSQGGGADDRIPNDIPDGSDDDIVARQLREAALAEEDPELREKLWDEYRKYKEGVQAKR